MIYRLIMLAGPLQGRRVAVDREPMTLGRGADCTLFIPDEEMALQHAIIEHRLDGLFIRDLGAMGGVLVNGREVKEWRLRHGDEVELGRTRFLVQALVQADVSGKRSGARALRRVFRAIMVIVILGAAGVYGYRKWDEIRLAIREPEPKSGYESLPERLTVPAEIVPAGISTDSLPAATDGLIVTNSEPVAVVEPSLPPVVVVTSVVVKVDEEIRTMREDLTELRKRMQELTTLQGAATNPPQAMVTTSVVHVTAPGSSLPPEQNAIDVKVQGMLKEADTLIVAGKDALADRLLDSLEVLDPGLLEVYERRARLFEKRRMPERAMEQWLELIDRGKGSLFYDRAVTEFGRLDAQIPQPPPPKKGRLKISSVEHHKFPESEDFSEMRVVDIMLAPYPEAGLIEVAAVRTEVTFYDEDLATGKIIATRALVSVSPPKPERAWPTGELRVVTATYVVPKKAGAAVPRREQYYGYKVRVFLGGALQAEDARPKSLLGVAGAMRSSSGRQIAGR